VGEGREGATDDGAVPEPTPVFEASSCTHLTWTLVTGLRCWSGLAPRVVVVFPGGLPCASWMPRLFWRCPRVAWALWVGLVAAFQQQQLGSGALVGRLTQGSLGFVGGLGCCFSATTAGQGGIAGSSYSCHLCVNGGKLGGSRFELGWRVSIAHRWERRCGIGRALPRSAWQRGGWGRDRPGEGVRPLAFVRHQSRRG